MTPEENRRQKIAEELARRGFLQAALPDKRDTLVDFRALFDLGKSRGREYREGIPFPHIVIDDFLPADSYRAVQDALPTLENPSTNWGNLDSTTKDGRPAQKLKYHLQNVLLMAPVVRQLILEMNSGPFTMWLQQLTGIQPLMSDPHLQGGGVHLVKPGGSLRVHADFNKHPAFRVHRRLNLLLYFNEDWPEEYGGHLELWSPDMSTCVKRLLPTANRCVIFNTSNDSFHGHPHPLTCPEGRFRRSIALYYYTPDPNLPPDPSGHSTLWQDLPDEKTG
ncbi:MAG TPA: 2OG-Fe(II) oxygenase [Polyangiaceae bacterium]|nr:2OG-Fe(II) oxygenase [Polyangiaceae bacterium]